MPGGDRRGPWGQGPMTGRGAGFCAGNAMPGYMNACGRGFFRGVGRGRGFRRWFFATGLPGWMRLGRPSPEDTSHYAGEDDASMLRNRSEILSRELEEIRMRLSEIEKKESQ